MKDNLHALNIILSKNPELREAWLQDATVHIYLKKYELNDITFEEALVGIATSLYKEKKHYFDEVVKLTSMAVNPPQVLVPGPVRVVGNRVNKIVTVIAIIGWLLLMAALAYSLAGGRMQ